MKKLLILISTLIVISCKKTAPTPVVDNSVDVFSKSQATVSNGSEIKFELKNVGVYTLTMKDSADNQVVTRERFMGKVGKTLLNIQ